MKAWKWGKGIEGRRAASLRVPRESLAEEQALSEDQTKVREQSGQRSA